MNKYFTLACLAFASVSASSHETLLKNKVRHRSLIGLDFDQLEKISSNPDNLNTILKSNNMDSMFLSRSDIEELSSHSLESSRPLESMSLHSISADDLTLDNLEKLAAHPDLLAHSDFS